VSEREGAEVTAEAATVDARYAFLKRLSRDAGALALDFWNRRDALLVELKGPADFVSHADRHVEESIRDAIARAFPGDTFLGEETSAGFAGDADRLWIVDPIDGTHNFLRGIPYWNVSIAYVEHGVRMLGAICDPVAGSVYHAMRGRGAWRSDARGETRLSVSSTRELPGAIVCVGHHDRRPEPRYLKLRAALMDVRASFRNFGCAALQIAHVAEGRYDAYVELDLASWDAMAGLLIVEEAGGHVGPFPGPDGLLARAPVIACAAGIAQPLGELLRESST
jgi:myo-inositol-1(or 4)-monophosphatase